MKKQIKIQISIDKDFWEIGNIECRIVDMLFTDISSSVLDEKPIIDKVKKFISKFKDMDVITINLTCGNEYDTRPDVISSFRYVKTSYCDKVVSYKKAKVSNQCYKEWIEGKTTKDIFSTIKDITQQANRLFIDLLKNSEVLA